MREKQIKSNGIHYTPAPLADFLARVTLDGLQTRGKLRVLDPACGDGSLLLAFWAALPEDACSKVEFVGYDTEQAAIELARARLAEAGVSDPTLVNGDFLESIDEVTVESGRTPLFGPPQGRQAELYDVIIANPPYVRTQVLGAERARALATRFGMAGRVDLYQVFVKAMFMALQPEGRIGLLTSNRFMLVQAGSSMRELLRSEFALRHVFDLGDTKFFSAAVLPAIIVGTKRVAANGLHSPCQFTRVYEHRADGEFEAVKPTASLLDSILNNDDGLFKTDHGVFSIERGLLQGNASDPWSLRSDRTDSWLGQIKRRTARVFGDVAKIKVGIKTTADSVFIRDDWEQLDVRPEESLLRPLLTHHVCFRWGMPESQHLRTRVLYTHVENGRGKRVPIELSDYPQASAYLNLHRTRLEGRNYVVDSGRRWYEIWVPQQPSEWARPKVVFPDIAEHPRFFLDSTGAVVNGDCYWMAPAAAASREWLLLILAVANSTFATSFYDARFHNKLYAGRRRFITQYVNEFPLPDPTTQSGARLIELAETLVAGGGPDLETEVDELVWEAFGVSQRRFSATGSGASC